VIDLVALQTFVVVAEARSLSAAGRRLACSTSAVSRRLDRAERDAGLPLLHRTNRRTSLTESGELYLPIARALLHEERRARQATTELQQRHSLVCAERSPAP
jgi:DNA-binding transcriptional LysR family regulator